MADPKVLCENVRPLRNVVDKHACASICKLKVQYAFPFTVFAFVLYLCLFFLFVIKDLSILITINFDIFKQVLFLSGIISMFMYLVLVVSSTCSTVSNLHGPGKGVQRAHSHRKQMFSQWESHIMRYPNFKPSHSCASVKEGIIFNLLPTVKYHEYTIIDRYDAKLMIDCSGWRVRPSYSVTLESCNIRSQKSVRNFASKWWARLTYRIIGFDKSHLSFPCIYLQDFSRSIGMI